MKRGKTKKKPTPAEKLRRGLPPLTNWNTTDEQEINRRRLRAMEEPPLLIENIDPGHPIFSNFGVKSRSGEDYCVEIRDLKNRIFASDTIDFQINGLGTDKHIEAVLIHLEKTQSEAFAEALESGSNRVDVVPAPDGLRVERNLALVPPALLKWVSADGNIVDPEGFLTAAKRSRSNGLRISQEVAPWMESRRKEAERKLLRRAYESKVVSGEYPPHETKLPLYPYQREGMLHLAFTERAMLADEMGLGKTIQAVAASALLHRLGKAKRVLVVTPASLKAEWEEQIAKFSDLESRVVFGPPEKRWRLYKEGAFFTLVNYEQVLRDFDSINQFMRPDIVILDEAQRIKNWSTKTAQAIKKLKSRYAFVLTGTPIENRIDDLYSIVNFIDPVRLGSLFRFNRDYYQFDERGRPQEYQNLDRLHKRIQPLMVRRRKADVEKELPDRSDKTLFVTMNAVQWDFYKQHEQRVSGLLQKAKKQPLRKEELDRLQRELAMMRMICDTPYILDSAYKKVCPKLVEIKSLLDEVLSEPDVKVVIFSEWIRMLELIREHCQKSGIGTVWHTGSVPQKRRRKEINRFKSDPRARLFLSSDSGGVGLNLQNASVVINCDLPWNPAKLEQRIARVWRKHQQRQVTVIHLVSKQTIEHRMIETLTNKQNLANAVLDRTVDFAAVKMKGGSQTFFERLEMLMEKPATGKPKPSKPVPASEQPALFVEKLVQKLGETLLGCDERMVGEKSKIIVTVNGNADQMKARIASIAQETFSQECELEIIDQQTAETIARLVEAGILQQAGQKRVLYPAPEKEALPERIKIRMAELKSEAERKLAMAKLLVDNGFDDGAIAPMQDVIRHLTTVQALGKNLPEPALEEEDFSTYWDAATAAFMNAPSKKSVASCLASAAEVLNG